MVKPPGTTLDDPVTEDHRPDLRSSLREITEYFENEGAYDIFDHLLRELLTKQPADPVQHMIDCLGCKHPRGCPQVIVSSPPGLGRRHLCRRLADHFGLTLISAGDLLRKNQVDVSSKGFADEVQVTGMVMEAVQEATSRMEGWVLDGFPRTRLQATYLKERSVVPTHVLSLKASEEYILERQRRIADGEVEGEEVVAPELLAERLDLYTCHNMSALEIYRAVTKDIDLLAGADAAFAEMERTVSRMPSSRDALADCRSW